MFLFLKNYKNNNTYTKSQKAYQETFFEALIVNFSVLVFVDHRIECVLRLNLLFTKGFVIDWNFC